MTESEIQILLMGYLDGELDDAARARVEQALTDDAELRAEYESMRRLADVTAAVAADDVGDEALAQFWNDVYNRTERHAAWIMLLLGLAGLIAGACYFFFTSERTHWGVKLAGASLVLGSLLLLWSVWRERQRLLPHDRYHREVHR